MNLGSVREVSSELVCVVGSTTAGAFDGVEERDRESILGDIPSASASNRA
jgi:hypothetical protein